MPGLGVLYLMPSEPEWEPLPWGQALTGAGALVRSIQPSFSPARIGSPQSHKGQPGKGQVDNARLCPR